MSYEKRRENYIQLEKARKSKLICYVTGTRAGLETAIAPDTYTLMAQHLDEIGPVKKISLFLLTNGGQTMAAWSLINLIKHYCDDFEVIVPFQALSAGTLMCLAADNIVMAKQATLGPIDPSVNQPLNPQHPNNPNVRIPVSVEAIQGYFDLAGEELKISDQAEKAKIFLKLAESIHPLVLGTAFRARTQIQMLARKLLMGRMEEVKIDRIIKFLCSDSGSHDYPIHRREARKELGLPIETPSVPLYALIKSTFAAIDEDLQFSGRLDPNSVLAGGNEREYSYTRAIIESVGGGSHAYLTEGRYQRHNPSNGGAPAIQDMRLFEGWKHSPSAHLPQTDSQKPSRKRSPKAPEIPNAP
ncbi:SDH family Clp fold serine proteinase [Prosthecobacter sp.]|uniref:SDH family Clp fold serine proteinase n=1 Tax=Prosthecobacter sp. TaxID=1965333 RepID=UPI003783D299